MLALPLGSCVTLRLSPNPSGSEEFMLCCVLAFLGGGISALELSWGHLVLGYLHCLGKRKELGLSPVAEFCATFVSPTPNFS